MSLESQCWPKSQKEIGITSSFDNVSVEMLGWAVIFKTLYYMKH